MQKLGKEMMNERKMDVNKSEAKCEQENYPSAASQAWSMTTLVSS